MLSKNAFSTASPRLRCADRKSLLLGTAMVTTLFFATITAPTPAAAVITCAGDVGPTIDHTNGGAGYNESIFCVNTKPRTGGPFAIGLGTDGLDRSICRLNSWQKRSIARWASIPSDAPTSSEMGALHRDATH